MVYGCDNRDVINLNHTQGQTSNSYQRTYEYNHTSHPRAVSRTIASPGNQATIYAYDKNGNMTQDLTFSSTDRRMAWDDNDRMRAFRMGSALAHNVYDSEGERVMKAVGTYSGNTVSIAGKYALFPNGYTTLSHTQDITKHYYMGSQRIASRLDVDQNYNQGHLSHPQLPDLNDALSYDLIDAVIVINGQGSAGSQAPCSSHPTGSEISKQCYCTTQNICNDVIYFYHSDHLGSSTYITNSTGQEYQFLQYLPFGSIFVEQKVAGQSVDYKFGGKFLDEESGLYHFEARYLNPSLPGFLSADKMSEAAPGWTPYRAFGQNPLRYTDPTGLFEEDTDPPKNVLPVVTVSAQRMGTQRDRSMSRYGYRGSMASYKQEYGFGGMSDHNVSNYWNQVHSADFDAWVAGQDQAEDQRIASEKMRFWFGMVFPAVTTVLAPSNGGVTGVGLSPRAFRFSMPAVSTNSTIYRAVSKAELNDIASFGLRNKAGAYETGKLFAPTAREAGQFGRNNFMFDGVPNHIMKVSVPNSVLKNSYKFGADGMNAISIPANQLHKLKATPLNYTPLR